MQFSINEASIPRLLLIILALVITSLSAAAQTRSVTVSDGSGSGAYPPNATVHLWANPDPTGKVFDRWTGDTSSLVDPYAAHTTLVMPQTNISLTATYKNAPVWKPTLEVINGTNVTYYFPQSHASVLFRFHGTGGSGASFFDKVEDNQFARDAVAAGYAVVALDSADRVNKQWDNSSPPSSNRDIQNVQAAIASFVGRGLMNANDALFAQGMSNGGPFAAHVSYYLNFKATAVFCASAIAQLIAVSTVPTIWNIARNDGNIGAAGNQRALDNFNNFLGRKLTAQFNVNQPSPVYPLRFWRIPGVSQTDSQNIYQSLKSGGFLDANNFLLVSPENNTAALQIAIPVQYAAYRSDILDQLDVCYTEHKFYSDNNHQVLAFFNASRLNTPPTTTVSAANYTPVLATEAIVSAFGTSLATGTQIADAIPLPTSLTETRVAVTDSTGTTRLAPLFFVSPTQINYQIPPGTFAGKVGVTVTNGNGIIVPGAAIVNIVAPGLFSTDASGSGLPAANVLRVKANGSQQFEPVARYDATQNKFVAVPIDLSNASDQVFLILFGTGVRYRSSLSNVSAKIGGTDAPVSFAGAQGGFVGLDQVNVLLPGSLAGRGEVDAALTVDGISANSLKVSIR